MRVETAAETATGKVGDVPRSTADPGAFGHGNLRLGIPRSPELARDDMHGDGRALQKGTCSPAASPYLSFRGRFSATEESRDGSVLGDCKRPVAVRMAGILLLAVGILLCADAGAAELVPNGSFEEGMAGWELVVSGGADAEASVAQDRIGDGSCAQVELKKHDSFAGWEIALQAPISEPLDPSRLYKLELTAASAERGYVEFCIQRAEAPYGILHLARVATGPQPCTLGLYLPRASEEADMRLSVWFGNGPAGTYWVDDIAVKALTDEEMAALEQMPEGWQNGDFSAGLSGWELRVHDEAVATLAVDPEPKFGDGNCARVDVTNSTETGWHVQFMQIFNMQKDRTYTATFSAVADRDVEIIVGYQVPPPDNAGFGSGSVRLTTEPQTFAVESNPITRDTPMKLSFHLSGVGEGTFWFDKVSVTATEDAE